MSDREILFRGKRLDNGEWVESPYPFGTIVGGVVVHDFDPSTVSPYTGLTDKHGARIFEGDIVKGDVPELPMYQGVVGVIKWSHDVKMRGAAFVVDFSESYPPWKMTSVGFCSFTNLEVIGNRWNDPELMGGDTNA